MSEKQFKAFISYSRVNKDFALRLAEELRAEGFPVWLDQLDIPLGARWDREVERALKACEIFMIIMTPTAIDSENVLDEIGYAIDHRKRILPILLEKCEVPLRLRRIQYVDFTNKSFDDGVKGAKGLLSSLIARAQAEWKAEEDRATKAEEARLAAEKAEVERRAKEEADRLAAQKREEERIALAIVESARLAAEEEEAERRAKEETGRQAALKEEQDRQVRLKAEQQARERAARIAAWKAYVERGISLLKKPWARPAAAGIVVMLAVSASVLVLRSLSNTGTPPATEIPNFVLTAAAQTVQAIPTNVPETQASTIIAETPTLNTVIPDPGSTLEAGSTQPYVDGNVLVAVPAGEFSMGGEGNDNPKHRVTLSDYWIYSTKVTNQQYALCVSQDECTAPDGTDNPGYLEYERGNDPVTGVTYEQAVAYCGFVNGRLPTEAQWEKAAGSPQGGKYPWGDAAPTCDLLNFDNCMEGTTNVVNYPSGASFYGALDMSGNAFEWVADWYDANYYTESPTENPQGPEDGTRRSVRSSSYLSDEIQVSLAKRNFEDPSNHRTDLGFRCVVEEPTHFAPFCELPVSYSADSAAANSLVSCPALDIKQTPFCGATGSQTNVSFIGPTDATKDAQGCIASSDTLFTCSPPKTVVSITAACQLNETADVTCPAGYLEQNGICSVNEMGQTAENCLAGEYDPSLQCCNLPKAQSEGVAALKICPVGSFPTANAKVCISQPVPAIVTYSEELEYTACSSTAGGGGGGGNASGGGGGGSCSTQSCGSGLVWSSSSCCCVAPGSEVCQ